jgi:hypothetical protein
MLKLILGICVAVLVAALAGWIWGASGTSAKARALQTLQLRDELLEARAAVLDARLDIYSVNFGEASRHFEAARSGVRAASQQLNSLGRQDDVKRLELALTRIDEAQRLAGQLNQDANARAAEGAKAIADVLGTVPVDK